ncbi:MAG TPA: HNH endonuclease [Polyangiaceae bacterium]|nr:HNH endonuclease [Polyangiaceae bacterium]
MFRIISICNGGHYRYCRTEPKHPKANAKGLYPLHRVLVEIRLGRLLKSTELVHHIDENPQNDEPANLEVMTRSEHARHHMTPERKAALRAVHTSGPTGASF